jgi:hypothetical protein
MPTSMSKYWCFTLNNPTADEGNKLFRLQEEAEITYACIGFEEGEEGTEHLQGYVELRTRKRMSTVKNVLFRRGHYEVRRGSPTQASEYCQKDGLYIEWGERSSGRRGERTDLLTIKHKLDQGCSMRKIADEHFAQWLIHRKGLGEYLSLKQDRRTWKSEVFIYWGAAGTGKTRKVFDEEKDLWVAPDNQLQWFNGYSGQEAVLFDDFTFLPAKKLDFWLKMCDRYAMDVPTKGGYVNWIPKRIYFTSNVDWRDWPTEAISDESKRAIERRIDRVLHFDRQFN